MQMCIFFIHNLNTQIFIFFIWKYFLIQCEHAVEPKPTIFFSLFLRVAIFFHPTMLLFRVERQNWNEKNVCKKKRNK